MFLNIKISKATPERALKYASDKNILETTKTRNLITSKSPAEEMRDTARRFGKWQSNKDRKTFSLVISPSPKDTPTKEQVMEITEAVLDHFFPTIQGLIILHKDKGKDSKKTSPVLHSHFYGSIIDPTTGKNIHLSDTDIRHIRAWADEYAEREYNWKPFNRGTQNKAKAYNKSLMEKINSKGKTGWLDKLKSNVNDAYIKSESFKDFCSLLNERGITVLQEEETHDIKFEIHEKGRTYQVNAETIGDKFCWNRLQQKYDNRRNTYAGSERNTCQNKAQLGAGNTRTGESSRTGYVGKYKVNFGCIFCTKDKDICKRCTEYKYREREVHGSRSL